MLSGFTFRSIKSATMNPAAISPIFTLEENAVESMLIPKSPKTLDKAASIPGLFTTDIYSIL